MKNTLPDAYILMRVYFPAKGKIQIRRRLRTALASAAENMAQYRRAGGRAWMLINDDTGAAPGLLAGVLVHAGLQREQYVITRTQGLGSAFAMHRLQSEFLSQTERHSEAFAMILDQDDRLTDGALLYIGRKMEPKAIVISPFRVEDPAGLDILDDGGRRHNRIARRICAGTALRKDLAALSSIAWTKSYSREALQQYHDDLTELLDNTRGSAPRFLSEIRAYDDFVDFYTLLQRNTKINAVYFPTHIYIKHDAAITANPRVKDFKTNRVAMLLVLTDLCFRNRNKLCADFMTMLRTYLFIKIANIRSVIRKYETDGKDHAFLQKVNSSPAYIAGCLADAALHGPAEPTDEQTPIRSEQTAENLMTLLRIPRRTDKTPDEEIKQLLIKESQDERHLYSF